MRTGQADVDSTPAGHISWFYRQSSTDADFIAYFQAIRDRTIHHDKLLHVLHAMVDIDRRSKEQD